jgi:hypothetical protein
MALTEVADKPFNTAIVNMDGKRFTRCKFTNCKLRYTGGECEWDNNTTFVACSWEFQDAALRTAKLFMLGQDTANFTLAGRNFSTKF